MSASKGNNRGLEDRGWEQRGSGSSMVNSLGSKKLLSWTKWEHSPLEASVVQRDYTQADETCDSLLRKFPITIPVPGVRTGPGPRIGAWGGNSGLGDRGLGQVNLLSLAPNKNVWLK